MRRMRSADGERQSRNLVFTNHLIRTSMLLLLICVLMARGQESTFTGNTVNEESVDAVVQRLTLEQKIDLLGGEDHLFTRAVQSAGINRYKMSDGPEGVRAFGPSQAYPGGIALAATWNMNLAEQIGEKIGEDANARGVNILLGPGMNIYRAPMNGRNFEYFGEDPWLASRMAVGFVRGLQSRHVVATLKHFACNNSEYDRHDADAVVDERTLREIYLPAFEAAVKEAHAGAVMDSYNLLNGKHSVQNHWLNMDLLKKEWGFDGVVMSDWAEPQFTFLTDGVAAAKDGLDLEMPYAKFMNRATLLPAIRSGALSESVIDDKVRRLIRMGMRFGFFGSPYVPEHPVPLFNRSALPVALQGAEESIVLLKNEGGLLPLKPGLRRIAVIGPDAYPPVPGGGGSSFTTAFELKSFLVGISQAATPGTVVEWNRGVRDEHDVFERSRFSTDAAGLHSGLLQQLIVSSKPSDAATTIARVDYFNFPVRALANTTYRWSGYYLPTKSSACTLLVAGRDKGHYDLFVDGVLATANHSGDAQTPHALQLNCQQGKAIAVRLEFTPSPDRPGLDHPGRANLGAGLTIVPSDELIDPAALTIARAADVVILNVGFNPATETEGSDRSWALPYGQDELIEKVAAINPRTIVTLTAGGGTDVRGWIDKVPGLLHTWYGGQEAGDALANVVFGRANPSGKLPITFERNIEDNPTFAHYYEEPGSKKIHYAEGISVGYRYFDLPDAKAKPLFPFGFGLSYTTFAMSGLKITPNGPPENRDYTVMFTVRNTGSMAGAEVAQLYVGDPSATVNRPVKELKAFAKTKLAPGEEQQVTLQLNRRSFAYWSETKKAWTVDPGKFVLYVGDSSQNTPLQQTLSLR